MRRTAVNGFVVRIDLGAADTDLFEQFLIENDLMDDPKAVIRAMILGAIRDPRWALATVDRRVNLAKFRQALWSKVVTKLKEIQDEVNDELTLLAQETATEVRPDDVDQA